MRVKLGRVRTAREILGTKEMVNEFSVLDNGHHYAFSDRMNTWGRINAMLVFIPIRADLNHLAYRWLGTLDGENFNLFRKDWVDILSEQEMPEDDPRVVMLLKAAKKGLNLEPEDIERKMDEASA